MQADLIEYLGPAHIEKDTKNIHFGKTRAGSLSDAQYKVFFPGHNETFLSFEKVT